jgi:hypothetical protein
MVITQNKCFLIPVPVGIVCRTDIKERILLYWLLKNSRIDGDIILPSDIATIIMDLFLEILKR